jgi:hypothetical protein
MSWIETLSPNLPSYLNAWINLRGSRKVPSLESCPELMKTVVLDFAAIVDVSEKRECTFLHVGQNVEVLYPGCERGSRFSNLNPVTLRLTISRPINEVITTRQPLTRRSSYRVADSDAFYEQLFLPFVDKNFEVRKIVIVGDGYSLARSNT